MRFHHGLLPILKIAHCVPKLCDNSKLTRLFLTAGRDLGEHHKVFNFLVNYVSVSCKYITFIGSFVLIGGVVIACVNIILSAVNSSMKKHIPMLMAQHSPDGKSKSANFNRVRLQLGEITALGLEILVVSDIMETLTKLDTNDFTYRALGKIGAVALFRTALAYTLGYEVKEIQKEIHAEDRAEMLRA